jgi:hypothetical protein
MLRPPPARAQAGSGKVSTKQANKAKDIRKIPLFFVMAGCPRFVAQHSLAKNGAVANRL